MCVCVCFQSSKCFSSVAFLLNVSPKGRPAMGNWHVMRRDYLSFGFSLQVWNFMQNGAQFCEDLVQCVSCNSFYPLLLIVVYYVSVVFTSPIEAAGRDHRPHRAECVCVLDSGKTLHTGQPQSMSCLSHARTTNMLNMTTIKIRMKNEMLERHPCIRGCSFVRLFVCSFVRFLFRFIMYRGL